LALQKSIIPVKFDGGIDTKTADQLVVPGSFHLLQNCIRKKTGKIEKRFGFLSLTNQVSGDGPITTGRHLDQLDNVPLLFDGFKAYAYSKSATKWISRGTAEVARGTSYTIIHDTGDQSQSDVAYNNGLTATIYYSNTTNNPGLHYSIYEDSTGTGVVIDAPLQFLLGTRPRVVSIAT
jgi:hypothetical protein